MRIRKINRFLGLAMVLVLVLVLSAVRRSVSLVSANKALLVQKRRTHDFSIGTWTVFHEVACVLSFR